MLHKNPYHVHPLNSEGNSEQDKHELIHGRSNESCKHRHLLTVMLSEQCAGGRCWRPCITKVGWDRGQQQANSSTSHCSPATLIGFKK